MTAPAARPSLSPSLAANPRVLFVVPGDGQNSSMIFVSRQSRSLASEGVEASLFYLANILRLKFVSYKV